MGLEGGCEAAREYALTGRYREAGEVLRRMLDEQPSHVEALLLLGKVEYYLGHASRSRRCFETALAYDPTNLAAFFGIEHYRGRRRAAAFAGTAIVLAALLAAAAGLVARRSVVVLRDANARIAVAVDGLSRSMADMARAIEEVRGEALEKAGETAKSLDGVSSELAKIRKETAALSRRIDEVKQAVAKAAGREPDTGAAPTSP